MGFITIFHHHLGENIFLELLPSSEEANPSGWLFQDTLCATPGKNPATNLDPMARLRVIFPSEKALRGPMLS